MKYKSFIAGLLLTLTPVTTENMPNDRYKAIEKKIELSTDNRIDYSLMEGGRAELIRENKIIDNYGLHRMKNDRMVRWYANGGYLKKMPRTTDNYYVVKDLPAKNLYARPWTKKFIEDLADDFHREFDKKLPITSLVRPEDYQKKLRRTNRNAAPEKGPAESLHPTGCAVDIARKLLTKKQREWVYSHVLAYQKFGFVSIIDEPRKPANIHFAVFPSYTNHEIKLNLSGPFTTADSLRN